MLASRVGELALVEKILHEWKINPNEGSRRGSSPLQMAAEEGHLDVATCLVDLHANVNSADYQGFTPLIVACENGHETMLQMLLERRAYPDLARHNGWTPLMTAAYHGFTPVCEALLQRRATPMLGAPHTDRAPSVPSHTTRCKCVCLRATHATTRSPPDVLGAGLRMPI